MSHLAPGATSSFAGRRPGAERAGSRPSALSACQVQCDRPYSCSSPWPPAELRFSSVRPLRPRSLHEYSAEDFASSILQAMHPLCAFVLLQPILLEYCSLPRRKRVRQAFGYLSIDPFFPAAFRIPTRWRLCPKYLPSRCAVSEIAVTRALAKCRAVEPGTRIRSR